MRPRVFPAEDGHPWVAVPEGQGASMRPRVFPAEDSCRSCQENSSIRCFNEAAGIPRGRHVQRPLIHLTYLLASMRPRVFPAEDCI